MVLSALYTCSFMALRNDVRIFKMQLYDSVLYIYKSRIHFVSVVFRWIQS